MKNKKIYIIKLNRKFLIYFLVFLILITIGLRKPWRTLKIFNPENQINIIVDPGHGGIDGGTGNIKDILEKDINLDVAIKLKREL